MGRRSAWPRCPGESKCSSSIETPSRRTKRDCKATSSSSMRRPELRSHGVRLHQLEAQTLAIEGQRPVEISHTDPDVGERHLRFHLASGSHIPVHDSALRSPALSSPSLAGHARGGQILDSGAIRREPHLVSPPGASEPTTSSRSRGSRPLRVLWSSTEPGVSSCSSRPTRAGGRSPVARWRTAGRRRGRRVGARSHEESGLGRRRAVDWSVSISSAPDRIDPVGCAFSSTAAPSMTRHSPASCSKKTRSPSTASRRWHRALELLSGPLRRRVRVVHRRHQHRVPRGRAPVADVDRLARRSTSRTLSSAAQQLPGPWSRGPSGTASPSTRIGTPFTRTCVIPTGWSAVSRSPSAGKS